MPHENKKQIEALGEIIRRCAERAGNALTDAQVAAVARGLAAQFDFAGKGTLVELKKWVLKMHEAGEYVNVGGSDNQAQNCAAEICC